MATVQNGIISYDDYLHFVYQCHNTLARYFSDYYISNYANGAGPDNSTQQSNGLADKIRILSNIVSGPFSYALPGSSGYASIDISTPSLPFTVDSAGKLVSTGGTYDTSKIKVVSLGKSITKDTVITVELIVHTLHAFYNSAPTFVATGTKAGSQDIKTPDLSNVVHGNCRGCIVSCNVSCGQGCSYNCADGWACNDCRESCQGCSGVGWCTPCTGSCGNSCSHRCSGCNYSCSGNCNACTGTCINMLATN